MLTPAFAEKVEGLLDEGDWIVIEEIARRPEAGKLIRGGAGLRKIRVALPGRGKRGGARVIYFWRREEILYFLDMYPKNEKEDLSAAELKAMVKLIEDL
ncbi:MAG: type II toxin-antitoxin system RelE/ParE family toxin [Planctomycetes bacterium]|nr:type II toxin-antitoxin system RelE/ParE family toxin [Planctomycetota bacterium]